MTGWRLDGANTTLLLLARDGGLPEIVHWGARLPDLSDNEARALRDRAIPQNVLDEDVAAATLMPTLGAGSFVAPGFAAHRDGQDWTAAFEVDAAKRQQHALLIEASDHAARLGLQLRLSLPPSGDVLTMRASLVNRGERALQVHHLAAGVFLLPASATALIAFGGRWGAEFSEQRIALPAGTLLLENRRGRTSHDRFPLFLGGEQGADEDRGTVFGIHLGWSGNHRIVADRLPDGRLLVSTGVLMHPGEAALAPGDTLETPAASAAWSNSGFAGLSRALHAHVRTHVLRWPDGEMTLRPVTLNTWEATYFAHDEARLMAQAEAAARLGIERFVLDDGWMIGRDDETAGLGDWTADPAKYPRGLGPLAQRVAALGMQFGLWVEPEMANPDSDFLRAHPDAALHVAGRELRTARHQLVIDLTRPDVFAAIHASLGRLLADLPIAYLKWDMNRELVAAGDAQGRPAYGAQVRALYALIDRLLADHPALEIESCASGGGRADLGILSRTHRVWTSDCTDALDRLRIQRGASRLLPPEILGAHVSASPNHQTGRRHTLDFRAAVALFFHFGVELDPLALTAQEAAQLAAWIALHKRLRPLLHAGEHVASPMQDGRSLRGVVAGDRRHAAFLIAQETSSLHAQPAPSLFPGLEPAVQYRLTAPEPQTRPPRLSATHARLFESGIVLSGGLLAEAGFVPPPLQPESALVIEAVREGAA